MELGLKGRVALVAAASQGLGRAVAMGLKAEGARVAVCARNVEACADMGVFARAVDVRDAEAVRAFVREVEEELGGVDICVANAGGPPAKYFAETTAADWAGALELNFLSAVTLAGAVLPGMKERGWGRFVAITSVAVKQPVEKLVLSNAVRAGVSGLVKSLANEYGPYGVLVNNVAPGYTATARVRNLGLDEGKLAEQIPLRRLGRPEEFADVVVFLCSERASYVNGITIPVDGGFVKGV